jgi:beta-glucosidase
VPIYPLTRRPSAVLATAVLAVVTATTGVVLVAPSAVAAPAPMKNSQAASPWMNTALSADERASLLVARMSLSQKVATLVQSGGPGVPELGVPGIRGKDGCCGLAASTPTTALPVGVALASTFDREAAFAYGAVAGEETRLTGFNAIAGPTMDLTTTPYNGRMWEALGEDPLLSGTTATAQVQGQQSNDVHSIVKHYNLNNFESRRSHTDVQVSERALQEVYTRPWEKVVKQGQPGSVMCSFNKVAGNYACGSDLLLNQILKEQLGFAGYVSSDYDAAKSFSDYAAGLDVAGPGLQLSGPSLEAAVRDGRVSESRVTDAARRVLRTMFDLGIIDNPPVGSFAYPQPAEPAIAPAVLDENATVAEAVADDAIVLLKNDASALPLTSTAGKKIAVIGSDADHYIDGGGSGAVPNPARLTTLLDGITQRASGSTVTYAPGTDPVSLADTLPGPAPVPGSVLSNLNAEYRMGAGNFEGRAFIARPEAQVNLRTGLSADVITTSQVPSLGFPLVGGPVSARWTGTLTAPADGSYGLSVSHLGTARLYVDGALVINDPGTMYGTQTHQVALTKGQKVDVRIEYQTDAPNQFDGGLNDQPGAMMRFGWTPPADVLSPKMAEAVAAAAASDVAVIVARDYLGESADRGTLTLPQDQDRLIAAVTKANPNTVVVLATGGPVTMPWLNQVPAVVEAWYTGQSQGRSVAKVLFGDVNPSGKLPVTFPASEQQVAGLGILDPFQFAEEQSKTVSYDQDVFVGYRGYQAQGAKPLFPFGHGLSYTTFDLAKLKVKNVNLKAAAAAEKTGSITVDVANTGRVAGEQVVQVYVGKLPTSVATPTKQLAGYARVSLQPGATSKVTIDLDERALQYWDEATNAWVTPKGNVPVYVGTSVDDIRQAGQISIK